MVKRVCTGKPFGGSKSGIVVQVVLTWVDGGWTLKDLLNQTSMSSIEEEESEDLREDSYFTLAGLPRWLKTFLAIRHLGANLVHPWVKAMDIVGLSWPACLSNIA